MQSNYSKEVIAKASKIRAVFFDVDGVLTDGKIIYDNNELESKEFNVKDGQIIKYLKQFQIITAVITGRDSLVVRNRCQELKIDHHFHGIKNKREIYNALKDELALEDEAIAYIGDDINDLPILSHCGLSCTPKDGHYIVQEQVNLVLNKAGGEGCLRELSDLILHTQGHYKEILKTLI